MNGGSRMFTESASFYDAIYAFKDYDAEMREAFLAEGLRPEYDDEGLIGRGLWMATADDGGLR